MKRRYAIIMACLIAAQSWAAEPTAPPPAEWPSEVERGETIVLTATSDKVAWAVLPADTSLWLLRNEAGESVLVIETLDAPDVLTVSMATANGDVEIVLHQIGVGGPIPDPHPGPDPEPDPIPIPPPTSKRLIVVLHEASRTGTVAAEKAAVLTALRKFSKTSPDLSHRFPDQDQVHAQTDNVLPEIKAWLTAAEKAKVPLPALLIIAPRAPPAEDVDGLVLAVEPLPSTAAEAIEKVKEYIHATP